MAKRQRFHVTLHTGEQVWLTGNTISEAFANGLQKYGTDAPQRASKTFKQYTEEWWNLYKIPKHKPTTLQTYRCLIDKHILPFFGGMLLSAIDTNSIQRFINERMSLSKSSVNQMRVLLHEICAAAVEDGYMAVDPTTSKRLTLPKRKSTREALSTDEYMHVLQQLPLLKPNDAVMVALLAYTGMRRGEMLGLKWGDIDFEDGLISVSRSVSFKGNQPIVGTPKSNAGYRSIPIVPALTAYLKQEQADAYVVGGKNQPITESTFDRAWQRIRTTINLHGATPHVLRHTYLTELGATETNVKTIQAIAGHADIQTTMNRYVHSRMEGIQAAGVAFEKLTANLTLANVRKAM